MIQWNNSCTAMQLLAILTLVLLYVPYGICFSFPLKLTRKHALSMNAVREYDSISALRKCGAATATCAAIFWGSFLPLTDYATSKGASTAVVHAAVGEGDLPDGAMAFQKILKFKVRTHPTFAAHPCTPLLKYHDSV